MRTDGVMDASLPEFLATYPDHPNVQFRIAVEDSMVDIVADDCDHDASIRNGGTVPQDMVAGQAI